jgi:hypothetical protein
MLTAIVVSLGTTGVGLSLLLRIREKYGTIEEDDLLKKQALAAARDRKKHRQLHQLDEDPDRKGE